MSKLLEDTKLINESSISISDVICGRGTKYCTHSGNQTYHALVKHFIPDYASARKKTDKTQISKAIVDAVNHTTPPGRFLSKSKDGNFREMENSKAREKTSQLLRENVMIGKTNHRTMYQKKKFDKILKSTRFKTRACHKPFLAVVPSFSPNGISPPSPPDKNAINGRYKFSRNSTNIALLMFPHYQRQSANNPPFVSFCENDSRCDTPYAAPRNYTIHKSPHTTAPPNNSYALCPTTQGTQLSPALNRPLFQTNVHGASSNLSFVERRREEMNTWCIQPNNSATPSLERLREYRTHHQASLRRRCTVPTP